jgi:erythromycin esterase-like protein
MSLRADAEKVAASARPFSQPQHHADLVAAIGERRVVLIGEASHGTHEFYEVRAELTKRLIAEKGFARSRWKRIGRTRCG